MRRFVRELSPAIASKQGKLSQVESSTICGSNSMVECHPSKVDVAGSSPVSRSQDLWNLNAAVLVVRSSP